MFNPFKKKPFGIDDFAKLGQAKWDDVMRIADGLFLDTQMFPARFYVSKFPTDEQLTAVIQEQRL